MEEHIYILISWPESQELMEEDWFSTEASLDMREYNGDAAYFIPLKRYLEWENIQ